jgi:hypothetical protein
LNASQITAMPVTIRSGNANRLSAFQPSRYRIAPEIAELAPITANTVMSLMPCALAFSSGR